MSRVATKKGKVIRGRAPHKPTRVEQSLKKDHQRKVVKKRVKKLTR